MLYLPCVRESSNSHASLTSPNEISMDSYDEDKYIRFENYRSIDANTVAGRNKHLERHLQNMNFQKRFKKEIQKRKLHKLSKTKTVTITCPELSNKTFTNDPPFNILGIPECAEYVRPKMKLYLPMNKELNLNASECDLIPIHLPNQNTSDCFKQLERRKDVGKVVMIIHGFLKNFDVNWMHEMKDDIQAKDTKQTRVAVIIIGWGRGFEDVLSYKHVAANTRYISYAMFLIVREMHEIVKSRKLYVHCIGHSLGGQACGLAGKDLIAAGGDTLKLDRISGLDPAGPLFCEDVPYPFDYKHIDPKSRIGSTDARFVDIIHTDGKARYLDIGKLRILVYLEFGTMMALGNVDFYPGVAPNYGCFQPNCLDEELVNVMACSHSRAHLLYSSSIKGTTCSASSVCSGDPHHIPYNCKHLGGNANVININETIIHASELDNSFTKSPIKMGYWIDLKLSGLFTVNVTGSTPYCT